MNDGCRASSVLGGFALRWRPSRRSHGIWGDGRRLYIGHESGNRVTVVDVNNPDDPTDDAVAGVVSGQASDLAFVEQPIDVVVKP